MSEETTAEMIMNGLLCQECGAYMEDFEEPGHPRTCADCKTEARPKHGKKAKAD